MKTKYKRALQNLKDLKKTNNNGAFVPNSKKREIAKEEDIHAIYNNAKYEKSYIRTAIKLFEDYKNFILENFAKNKMQNKSSKKNSYFTEFNNMDNVKNFLLIEKGLIESTFKNRYNLLRRTLIKINGNSNSLINDIKIT